MKSTAAFIYNILLGGNTFSASHVAPPNRHPISFTKIQILEGSHQAGPYYKRECDFVGKDIDKSTSIEAQAYAYKRLWRCLRCAPAQVQLKLSEVTLRLSLVGLDPGADGSIAA